MLKKKPAQGFTLIEIMLVLVIAGILFVGVILLKPGLGQNPLQRELLHFSSALGVARDRAMQEASPYGVAIGLKGYRFYQLHEDWRWVEISGDQILNAHQWPDSVKPELQVEGVEVGLAGQVQPLVPQIYLLADGSNTPFVMYLDDGRDEKKALQFDANGEGKILASTK